RVLTREMGAGRDEGGAQEGRSRVERDLHRNRFHQRGEASLVAERLDETAVGKLGSELGRDAAADVDASDGERLEREISSLGAVDRREEVERLDAERVLAGKADFRDEGVAVAAFHPIPEPPRLRRPTRVPQESVDVEEPRPREHALVAHVTELTTEVAQQLGLAVGAGREVGVAALRRNHAVTRAVPD